MNIKDLAQAAVGSVVFGVVIDGKECAMRVEIAPNSCRNSQGRECIWRNSNEGCPRLGFCLRKYGKIGLRQDGNFVCYIPIKA